MRKESELKAAAQEIVDLGLQDEVTKVPIRLKVNMVSEDYIDFIKKAIPALLPEDKFTPLTETIIAELSGQTEEPDYPTLEEEIENTVKMKDLKEIVTNEPPFKPLRGKLSSFKDIDILKDEMFFLLKDKKTPMKEQRLPLDETQQEIANKLHEKLEDQPIKIAEEIVDVPNEEELIGKGMMHTGDIITRMPFNSLFKIKEKVLASVIADMQKNGYDISSPIVLWKNTVVDGHTRLEAAEAAGIAEIPVFQKEFKDEIEALEYAIHNQRDRRNMTDAELLKCIDALDKPMTKQEAGKKGAKNKFEDTVKKVRPTHEVTAETLGVSASKISDARSVMKDEKVKEEVATGKKSISAGAKEVREKKRAEKPVKVKEEKKTRIDAVCQVIKDYAGSEGMLIENIVVEADGVFVEWGEKSEIERIERAVETVISVLKALGLVEVLDDNEINIKKF